MTNGNPPENPQLQANADVSASAAYLEGQRAAIAAQINALGAAAGPGLRESLNRLDRSIAELHGNRPPATTAAPSKDTTRRNVETSRADIPSAAKDVVVGGAAGGVTSGVGLGYAVPAAMAAGAACADAGGIFTLSGAGAFASTGSVLLALPAAGALAGAYIKGPKGAAVGFGVGSAAQMIIMGSLGYSLAATWPLVVGGAAAVGATYTAGKIGKHLWNWLKIKRSRNTGGR